MSLNPFKFVHDKEKKLCKLAKKCGTAPEKLPTILQNPDIVTLVLKYLKIKDTDDEMPALLFDWNQAGFNDTNVPNCRNGVAGQTQGAIIAHILANGTTDVMNLNTLFIFRNEEQNSKLIAEIAELRKENAKLKQIIEENKKRDVRIEELEQKNIELETRLAILEQGKEAK
ncbi:6881_t:CDS:2, partial [Paraglomus occultum]